MGRIIGRWIQDTLKVDFVYYFGSLSQGEKRGSVKAFMETAEVKIMVSVSGVVGKRKCRCTDRGGLFVARLHR